MSPEENTQDMTPQEPKDNTEHNPKHNPEAPRTAGALEAESPAAAVAPETVERDVVVPETVAPSAVEREAAEEPEAPDTTRADAAPETPAAKPAEDEQAAAEPGTAAEAGTTERAATASKDAPAEPVEGAPAGAPPVAQVPADATAVSAAEVPVGPASTAPAPKQGRGAARVALSVVTGSLLVLGTGAAAVLSSGWSTPSRSLDVPAVAMPAGRTIMACAPAIKRVGGQEATDQAYSPGAATAASSLRALVLGDNAQRVPGAVLSGDDREIKRLSQEVPAETADKTEARATDGFSGVKGAAVSGLKMDDAAWLSVQPLGGLRSPGAATRTTVQASGDLSGLAITPCLPASNTVRLLGASTTLGHTAVLAVTNPSSTPASVSVSVSTAKGIASEGAVQPFTLEAGATRTINLAGTARDTDALMVQVVSSGAPISATVSQQILRGVKPGGIDVLQPAGAASTTQLMVGVPLQDDAASAAVGRSEDAGDETPQVQIADISGQGTTATVTARGTDGTAHVVAKDVQISANAVAAVPLKGLPAGSYSIEVKAQDPVIASTRALRGSDVNGPRDVGYFASGDPLSTDQVVATPDLPGSSLRLFASETDATLTIAPVALDGSVGATRTVKVAAGTTQMLDVNSFGKVTGLRIGASGGDAYASIVATAGPAGLSAMLLPPTQDAPSSTKVELLP